MVSGCISRFLFLEKENKREGTKVGIAEELVIEQTETFISVELGCNSSQAEWGNRSKMMK